VLEQLSHAIQGTIQIEQTKSDRFTNLLIASVGSGLAVTQVASSIMIAQNPTTKNPEFYQTSIFSKSLIFGATIPIIFWLMSRIWRKVQKH
jgi:hypothetical protein